MSLTPCLSSSRGIGMWPHSGMPGAPLGPQCLQHQHGGLVDREVRVVDAGAHLA